MIFYCIFLTFIFELDQWIYSLTVVSSDNTFVFSSSLVDIRIVISCEQGNKTVYLYRGGELVIHKLEVYN